MTIRQSRRIDRAFGWSILGLALLAWTGPASAQVRTGGATGAASTGGFSGGFSGSSGGFSGGFSGSSGGFSGGFSGSSGGFSGSSGGFSGGFSGNSGGFSGGSFSGSGSFSGGSFSGSMTGGRTPGGATGFGGTTYQGVSNTNPFYQTYQDPLAGGMATGTTTRTTFGVPMYNLSTTGTGNLTGGSALGISGGTSAVNFTPSPATYMTTPFMIGLGTPSGTVAPALPPRTVPPAVASQMQRAAQQVITQSSALPSKGDIRVSMYGPAVVLQGMVGDEHERRLAEGLVRLTPGINEVVNRLQVRTELTAPRPIPPP